MARRNRRRKLDDVLGIVEQELRENIGRTRAKADELRFKFEMTPRELYKNLSKYVIGQGEALQSVCNAVCYHYQSLSKSKENKKSNLLLIGPTGCGKTYAVEKVSQILETPLLISDATRFSGTGYVGENVDSLVQDLVIKAGGDLNTASRGIIYLDEIDKIAAVDGSGRDVSGRDVQNGLLKIVEAGDVKVLSKEGERIINTRDILFIGGGSFSGICNTLRGYSVADPTVQSDLNNDELLYEASAPEVIKALEKFGMIPELLGRIQVIARFRQLGKEDLIRILKESEESPLKDYKNDFKAYKIKVEFTPDSYETISELAYERGVGARGLKSVMEESLAPFKFYLPGTGIKNFSVSGKTILEPGETLLSLINAQKNKCKEVKNGKSTTKT